MFHDPGPARGFASAPQRKRTPETSVSFKVHDFKVQLRSKKQSDHGGLMDVYGGLMGFYGMYHLVIRYSSLLNMTMEIVDFPMKHGGSVHSYFRHYQRAFPTLTPTMNHYE